MLLWGALAALCWLSVGCMARPRLHCIIVSLYHGIIHPALMPDLTCLPCSPQHTAAEWVVAQGR